MTITLRLIALLCILLPSIHHLWSCKYRSRTNVGFSALYRSFAARKRFHDYFSWKASEEMRRFCNALFYVASHILIIQSNREYYNVEPLLYTQSKDVKRYTPIAFQTVTHYSIMKQLYTNEYFIESTYDRGIITSENDFMKNVQDLDAIF